MENFTLKNHICKALLMIALMTSSILFANGQAKPAATAKVPELKQLPVPKGAVALIDTFFKKYKEEGTGPAIDYLFGTNKLFNNAAQINLLKTKLDSLRQSIGTFHGKELIVQRSASPSLFFYSYLVKHENQPLRFTFMFYKPQNDWVLYRFKYDDQLDNELEDAGRINMKRP